MTSSVKRRVWTMPVILGVLTAVGLFVALFADGPGDAVSWVGLGIPVAVGSWYALRRSP